jgi:hypothetical protein
MLFVSTQMFEEVLPGMVWTEHEVETTTMNRAVPPYADTQESGRTFIHD